VRGGGEREGGREGVNTNFEELEIHNSFFSSFFILTPTVKLTPVRFVEEGGTRMGHTVMCDWKATYLSVRPLATAPACRFWWVCQVVVDALLFPGRQE
jgi:hypothetical protein